MKASDSPPSHPVAAAGERRVPDPAALLRWYDENARDLPWRARPGEIADPYRVWLSEVMLQQTTVAAVAPRFARFLARWPSVEALAAAPRADVLAEWAGLGYYTRARNLHACAQAVAAMGGFPETEAGLRALPGIGAYTAAAVAAIAFGAACLPVDGNIERVTARVFAIAAPLPGARPLLRREAQRLMPSARHGDFAQALMDLGATLCAPRGPKCPLCPWRADCAAHAQGVAAALPARAPKRAKPVRFGTCFVLFHDDAVWVAPRPETGLLGGMRAPPATDFAETAPDPAPPVAADWREAGEARHVFTHFALRLTVLTAAAPPGWTPPQGGLLPFPEARAAAPTVFRKALDRARAARSAGAGASRNPS